MTTVNLENGDHSHVLLVITSHSALGDTGEATGFWLSELTHPLFMLQDSGVIVDIASIEGGEAAIDPRGQDEHDPDNRRFLADEHLVAAMNNAPNLGELDIGKYQGILFAGGHGAMWDFPDNAAVQQAAAALYQAGGVVATVCHGAAALVNVKLDGGMPLVSGKQITAFTNEEEAAVELDDVVPFSLQDRLTERGAKFRTRPAWQEHVIVDERLITGQNPKSAKPVGIAMVKQLKALFDS